MKHPMRLVISGTRVAAATPRGRNTVLPTSQRVNEV